METTVWIAIIGATGVIGSAWFQGRSNRNTLRASEEREERQRVRDAQERQRDRDDARTSGAEAHTRAMATAEAARRRELQDRWLAERKEVHIEAIGAANAWVEELRVEKVSWDRWARRTTPEADDAFYVFAEAEQPAEAFFAVAPRVEIVGSPAAGAALRELRLALTQWSAEFMLEGLITQGDDAAIAAADRRYDELRQEAVRALTSYRDAAKVDLGTDS